MRDEYSIWHRLYKIPDNNKNNFDSNKDIVGDGYGNSYIVPNTGRTALKTLDDDYNYKFDYNFETREIEVYTRDRDSEIDANNYAFVDSYPLSIENFVDSPEYWYRQALNSMQEEIDSILSVQEALVINESFSKDYVITAEINDSDIDQEFLDQNFQGDYNMYHDTIIDTIVGEYNDIVSFYGQNVNITAVFDHTYGNLMLYVYFDLPLDKEELIEIFDEYETVVKSKLADAGLPIEKISFDLTDVG